MTKGFVEQPLALPKSAKYEYSGFLGTYHGISVKYSGILGTYRVILEKLVSIFGQ